MGESRRGRRTTLQTSRKGSGLPQAVTPDSLTDTERGSDNGPIPSETISCCTSDKADIQTDVYSLQPGVDCSRPPS